MKYKLGAGSLILAIALLCMSFDIQYSNGVAGYTGSPFDNGRKCANCHVSTGGGGTIYLSGNMPNWTYVPGQTYQLSCTIKQLGMPLFGYNLQVLNPANADAGGLGIVTGNTQSTVTFSGFPVSSYLIHQYNGGLSQDSAVFPFTWTAPTTNAPDSVTFWFCGIAANNNGVNGNGDYSINGFQLAKKASTAGLNTTSSQQTLDLIAAQQRNDELIVHFNTEAFHTYTLHFTDLNGRELFSSTENSISENRQTVTIPIGMIQHNGIYMVYLTRDHAFFASQKIYVR